MITGICLTVVSAMMYALALPNELVPYGVPFLGFIALVPYFIALYTAGSYRKAGILGFVFGIFAHAMSSYWLFFFQDFALWTIGSTSLVYGCLHFFVAMYIFHFSSKSASSSGFNKSGRDFALKAYRPFLIAAAWTAWEWAKSTGFLAFPWGLLAYSVHDIPVLIQIADTTGVYGLTFIIALANTLACEALLYCGSVRFSAESADWAAFLTRASVFLAVLLLWFSVYGTYRISRPVPVTSNATMVLVQHNEDSWSGRGEIAVLEKCQMLSKKGVARARAEGKEPVLVVWSETVLRRPFEDYKLYFRKNPPEKPFISFLSELGTPLLTGAPVVLNWDRYDATNSAILLDPDGNVRYSYAKQHPVPFAESIPFWEYQWMRDFMKKFVGMEGGWVMGTEHVIMEVPTVDGKTLKFGVPICFEDAFAPLCAEFFKKGADLLVNITNDSWSKTVSAETQHLVASKFRAIENRAVLVRSTNSGVTCVIDAEGNTLAQLPLFTDDVLVVDIPVQKLTAATTYQILGDWFPALMTLILFLVICVEYRHQRRKP